MGEHPRFWVAFSFLLISTAIAAVVSVSMVVKAHAETACAPYQEFQKTLLEKFNETPSGSGITEKGGGAIIVFASPDGATWTMARVGPDGSACMIGAGSDWLEVIPPKAPIEGELPS